MTTPDLHMEVSLALAIEKSTDFAVLVRTTFIASLVGLELHSWDQTTKQRIPNMRTFLMIIYISSGKLKITCFGPIRSMSSFSAAQTEKKLREKIGYSLFSGLISF